MFKKILLAILLLFILLFVFISIPEGKAGFASPHFNFIYSRQIDSVEIKIISDSLEGNYGRLARALDTDPESPVEVNIYAHRWRYIKATGNWGASGSIEGTGKLHFIRNDDRSEAVKIAIHEFTHAIVLKRLIDREPQPVDSKSFDRKFAGFPVWLWEAISVYEAGQFTNPLDLPYFSNGNPPSLDELNNRSKGGKIYTCGYTIIEYILENYGQSKLLELVDHYGNISGTLGIDETGFMQAWYQYVKGKYSRQGAL